jgi:hypothetical protein
MKLGSRTPTTDNSINEKIDEKIQEICRVISTSYYLGQDKTREKTTKTKEYIQMDLVGEALGNRQTRLMRVHVTIWVCFLVASSSPYLRSEDG